MLKWIGLRRSRKKKEYSPGLMPRILCLGIRYLFWWDYVIYEYARGSCHGCSGHDERDFIFAKKYGLPIKSGDQNEEMTLDSEQLDGAYTGSGVMVNSGPLLGLFSKTARRK